MKFFPAFLSLVVLVSSCCTTRSNIRLEPNSFVHLWRVVKLAGISKGITSASGFIIASKGGNSYAMTAGHFCIDDSPEEVGGDITATSISGEKYEAIIVRAFKGPDICFVQILGLIAPSVELASSAPKYGDRVFSLAAPFGLFERGMLPKLEGFYSGYSSLINRDTYTLPVRPGSSGSPVFDSDGKLVGMIVMAFIPFESIGFSVEYSIVLNHIRAFRRHLGDHIP